MLITSSLTAKGSDLPFFQSRPQSFVAFVVSKWCSQSSRFPDHWSRETKLWERDCHFTQELGYSCSWAEYYLQQNTFRRYFISSFLQVTWWASLIFFPSTGYEGYNSLLAELKHRPMTDWNWVFLTHEWTHGWKRARLSFWVPFSACYTDSCKTIITPYVE